MSGLLLHELVQDSSMFMAVESESSRPVWAISLYTHRQRACLGALISVSQAPMGPSAPSSPSFWSLLCCRFPQTGWITGRADVWEKERGNMLRETAGSTRMLTHSLSFTIPHMHILMLSVKKPCPYRNIKRENVINSNKNTLWLWLEKFGSYTCKLDSDKHDQINTTVSVNQPLFAFVIGSDTELKKKKVAVQGDIEKGKDTGSRQLQSTGLEGALFPIVLWLKAPPWDYPIQLDIPDWISALDQTQSLPWSGPDTDLTSLQSQCSLWVLELMLSWLPFTCHSSAIGLWSFSPAHKVESLHFCSHLFRI